MKVITICGSLKFIEEMKYYAEKLGLEGNCVLSIIYPTKDREKYTNEEIDLLQKEHFKRIELSDAIFVVNKNGYIGEAVRKEIDYAIELNKEVLYLENKIEIKLICDDKEQFMDLLLLGDEQENMIKKYLYRGKLFALYERDLKTVAVVTEEDDETCEIKNIATYEKYQGKGYGKFMINHIIENCKIKFKILLVGTGDSSKTLSFYKNCGFEYSHTVKNFFIDNYEHKMYEEGKQLIDMIYLKLEFMK